MRHEYYGVLHDYRYTTALVFGKQYIWNTTKSLLQEDLSLRWLDT